MAAPDQEAREQESQEKPVDKFHEQVEREAEERRHAAERLREDLESTDEES